MAKLLKIVHDNRAEKLLRFLNYIIDLLFIYLVIILFFGFIGFLLAVFAPNSVNGILSKFENTNSLLDRLLSLLFYALFMFFIEFLTKGRSLGKFITGTLVVKIDATPLTAKDYFKRNICRAIPFEVFSFLGNNGWHDSISDTRVVKKKSFEAALAQKLDFDNLGESN